MRERQQTVSANQAKNGITTEDLGATSYEIFQRMTGGELKQFSSIVEIDRLAWIEMASVAVKMLDVNSDAVVELSASRLGRNLYSQFCVSRGDQPEYESLNQRLRLAWEVVGRHLLNLIDSDGNPDIQDFANRAVDWYKARASVAA